VRDGVLVDVRSDEEHPLACNLCPKGLFSAELVYNKQRLQYPMRRTRPKGDPDPGWERITWDEALDTITTRLNEIKAESGPEAVVFARSGPAGSPMGELGPWVIRLANAFGSPNNIATTHICQWHRDGGSAYTYGIIGRWGSIGRAEFERSACILIWGNNVHATRNSLVPLIKKGVDRGAKLIVIDPRKTAIASMADLWLQVNPATDGALALSMINVMLEDKLYDHEFVRDWTTAPFLVRRDTGDFLRASDLTNGGDASSYVTVDVNNNEPRAYVPGTQPPAEPALDGTFTIRLANGEETECNTVLQLLRQLASEYPLDRAAELTGVPENQIREAARLMGANKPSCLYSWNGIEQNTNAMQTNRAVCILYALTGNYDTPGGNVLPPIIAANPIVDIRFLSPETEQKRLGFQERPLGPCGKTARSIQSYDVFRASLTGQPYPVKAMVGFGGNILLSNAPSAYGKEALSHLDFHVQTELFMSPTAELADIVLPAASSWESWFVGVNFHPLSEKAYIQLRPAVVPPQHESWSDLKIIFELAKRLGLGDRFWDGDIEAGFNYQFSPSNITVEQLRMNPGGIGIELSMEYRKFSQKDDRDNFRGFPTPSKRVEIYSSLFKEHGYDPLPVWKEPITIRYARSNEAEKYPLILISGKIAEYCHSQHRAIPSLRKRAQHPFLEINNLKAGELGIDDGDWVIMETPHNSITLQARVTDEISYNVVCTQNGWWQACPELNLPGYDPFSPEGANLNLVYSTEEIDPISGSLPLKGYPCRVRKA